MSTYNFDKVIDRRGTGALKLEALQPRYGDAHLLPLWVADMDFETPHFITDALRRRLSCLRLFLLGFFGFLGQVCVGQILGLVVGFR